MLTLEIIHPALTLEPLLFKVDGDTENGCRWRFIWLEPRDLF